MSKFYGVRSGRKPGIYASWDACKQQVDGFKGAEYKSFKSKREAEAYVGGGSRVGVGMGSGGGSASSSRAGSASSEVGVGRVTNGGASSASGSNFTGQRNEESGEVMRAFIDGSYDNSKKVYSYGSVITWKGKKIKLFGGDNDPRFVDFRNVAGEIIAATRTLQFAIENRVAAIEIYYDYAGIEKWAKREWKRNNALTTGYSDYVKSIEDQIAIRFIKVKAHSGHAENDEVDQLAKDALKSREKHNMIVE